MKKEPKYKYIRYLGGFNIYCDSVRIDRVTTEEEARRRVYELNGWKCKPKTLLKTQKV